MSSENLILSLVSDTFASTHTSDLARLAPINCKRINFTDSKTLASNLSKLQPDVFIVEHKLLLADDGLLEKLKANNPKLVNILLTDRDAQSNENEIMGLFADDLLDSCINFPASNLAIANCSSLIKQALFNKISINGQMPIKYVVEALSSALDAKCGYTAGHSLRVGKLSVFIGKALNLSQHDLFYLGLGGILHDIGKIGVPEAILWKESALDSSEKQIMNQHPVTSAKIVQDLKLLDVVREYVLHHHEFMDGSGYPANLSDENIPLGSRIILVADAYDAMTSDRPYRKAIGQVKAIEELNKHKGKQFDVQIVDCFIKAVKETPNFNVENLPLDLFE